MARQASLKLNQVHDMCHWTLQFRYTTCVTGHCSSGTRHESLDTAVQVHDMCHWTLQFMKPVNTDKIITGFKSFGASIKVSRKSVLC
jgi:hypothetical protein